MNITVTKDDIEQGQRRDPEQCAIARADARRAGTFRSYGSERDGFRFVGPPH